jgi:hypothetical protein
VVACFGPFVDSANLEARNCSVYAKHSVGSKIVLDAPKVTRLKWKLISVCLEIVLILTQGSCSVCAERTIGSEIVLDSPDGTPR